MQQRIDLLIIPEREIHPRTMSLHDTQKLDDDFRAWANKDLSFPGFFGVVDGVERIVEDAGLDHSGGG